MQSSSLSPGARWRAISTAVVFIPVAENSCGPPPSGEEGRKYRSFCLGCCRVEFEDVEELHAAKVDMITFYLCCCVICERVLMRLEVDKPNSVAMGGLKTTKLGILTMCCYTSFDMYTARFHEVPNLPGERRQRSFAGCL